VKVLNNPDMLDEGANVYLCVSSFKKHPIDGWKRRKENFSAGILLMIDDVGSGPGSKFPISHLDALPPTALIETSPGNHQAIYMFREPITDQRKFDALINAFVKARFLENDPGMKGVTRVFRPPLGINGKEKYRYEGRPFVVNMKEWNFKRRYTYDEICRAFGLSPVMTAEIKKYVHTVDVTDRVEAFKAVYHLAKRYGMVKGQDDRDHEWIHISCPWRDTHTGGIDNGAGLTLPSEVNQWYGAYKCHHGSCHERGWREFTDYVTELCAQVLDDANKRGAEDGG
jgi:hypothetical protein